MSINAHICQLIMSEVESIEKEPLFQSVKPSDGKPLSAWEPLKAFQTMKTLAPTLCSLLSQCLAGALEEAEKLEGT
jgi:hypothetical protein